MTMQSHPTSRWIGLSHALIIGISLTLLPGCATMLKSGNTQDVHVTSEPPGAQVFVEGRYSGTTPATVSLDRKLDRNLDIEHTGYKPYHSSLPATITPIYFANIFNIWGFFIDLGTGNAYVFPDSLALAALERQAGNAGVVDPLTRYRLQDLQPRPDDGLLVLYRSRTRNEPDISPRILIDGTGAGKLGPGDVIVRRLPVGNHVVTVKGDRGDAVQNVLLKGGFAQYARLATPMRGWHSEPGKITTTYSLVLTPKDEADALREVYYLLHAR